MSDPDYLDPDYLDPDTLYANADNYITFLYHPDEGLIWGAGGRHESVDHQEVLHKLPHWIDRGEKETGARSVDKKFWDWVGRHFLLGRAGVLHNRPIITFWNEEGYASLGGCLDALEAEAGFSYPDASTEIHTPSEVLFGDEIHAGETRRAGKTSLSPEQQEKLGLQRRLHLLRGTEKREALKKLGLWPDQPARHPMKRGLEAAGLLGPGAKWWAPQSEQIELIAQVIDEDL